MHFDLRKLDRGSRYKIIGSCVIPRPIAWVTTRSPEGVLNASPFSFFNALGDDPPVVVVGMVAHHEKRLKDTPENIRRTGEFVINLVDETHAEAMNLTSIDAPTGIEETALAGLELAESTEVSPPRIATAPVSFECRTMHFIETGPHQVAVIGEVLHAHVQDRFVTDAERIRLDVTAMQLIARLHGAGWYGRQTDMFDLRRPSWKAWTEEREGPPPDVADKAG
ncbi:MAG TPA: flavin reductase family protein [Novosphingobium sp.]|nr:flavin reductase family protein [Novosphingobium sp.]